MALATPAKVFDVSAALKALEPLGADTYCIAFGTGATQFCATPNGYSSTQLPPKVIKDILGGQVKKVLNASFGNDANSYFFTYEMRDGIIAHRAGNGILNSLRCFVDRISSTSKERASSLRVQLGANGSYVAWSGSLWVSRGISKGLRAVLRHLSSTGFDEVNGSQGVLTSGTIDNIAWHDDISWYFKNGDSHAELRTSKGAEVLREAWDNLTHAKLAYVAINPHSPTGGTFVLFEKAQDGYEPDFILRFEPEDVVSRLHSKRVPPPSYTQVINVPKNSEGLQVFQWAVSKYTGRSHEGDSWELELKKGERIKILKDMGNDWLLVEDRRKQNGWVHRSWLEFQLALHVDPREAYARFTIDVEKIFKAGNICTFPDLPCYINACTKDVCSPRKEDPYCLGICYHDLHELMRGSGDYCLDTLKMERNKWHPDRFARYCHPDHREALKEKAQALFVLFGVLMEKTPVPEPAA